MYGDLSLHSFLPWSQRRLDKAVLSDVIRAADLLKQERQRLTSPNLALLLVHDLLLSKGKIQAGDGPIKQAVLR